MDDAFPTFFHINQRGEEGYRDLPRLVAMSQPLVLWAPSSVLLSSPSSGIGPKQFLELLEARHIRVMGRYKWIHEPSVRDSDRWPGTAWDADIDGQIQRISEEDAGEPLAERRVVVAPEEEGYNWADDYLSKNPDESSTWYKRVRRKNAAQIIPSGTLEAVGALGFDSKAVARRIIRDAYNHGQALLESGARVPILHAFTHRRFIELLSEAPPISSATAPPQAPATPAPQLSAVSAMASELVKILAELDLQGQSNPKRLDRFLHSSGHGDLATWLSAMCSEYERHKPQMVDGMVLERLKRELGRSSFDSVMQGLKQHPDGAGMGVISLVSTIIGVAAHDSVATTLGLGAAVYSVGKGLVRELGLIPATFNGPQWPFLYTYGHAARKPELKKLNDALSALERSSSTPSRPVRRTKNPAPPTSRRARTSTDPRQGPN